MIFIYILIAFFAVLLVLNFIAPNQYEVNRKIVINRPVNEVYDYLKFIRNQDEWSPWKKKDPDMKQEQEGIDGEIGFIVKWFGNKEVGEGEQEIKHLAENESILTELRFIKPWKSQSDGYFKMEEREDGQTKLTWGFAGRNKFPFHIMMIFFNMEKAVGKDFDEGLASLKQILEN